MSVCQSCRTHETRLAAEQGDVARIARKLAHAPYPPSAKRLAELDRAKDQAAQAKATLDTHLAECQFVPTP